MKKLFTLAAALLASFSLWALTENSPSSATSDNAVVGTSYTIPGTYIAGTGGTQAGDMTSKGVKFRINKTVTGVDGNALQIQVNEGYKITQIAFCGHVNDNSKTSTIKQVIVDGTPIDVAEVTLPAKTSSVSFSYDANITSSLVLVFEGEGTQANLEYTVTYEITATTYTATYKANYGEVADFVDNTAIKVSDNMFEGPENSYFVGWNTQADGLGTDVAVGTSLSADITLYAQWKSFVACVTLDLSGADQTPAKNAEVLLTTESNGGKIFFAGAKDNDFAASFVPKDGKGIQLSKGGADSLRVELDGVTCLDVGSVIRVDLIAVNDGSAAINLVPVGKSAIPLSANANKDEKKSIYLEIKVGDDLVGSHIFRLQRTSSSVILDAIAIADCGEYVPTAIDNTETEVKAVKVIRNGQLFIEKNGVLYNAQGSVVK